MFLHTPINDVKSGMEISQSSAIAVIINMKYITDSARLSLLRRLKETATKEEYDDLKNSFKFYNQLKKRPKHHKKELNNFFKHLHEYLQKHEPFLQSLSDPLPYCGTDQYATRVRSAAADRGASLESRAYVRNYWSEEKQMRVAEEAKCFILRTDEGLCEFLHPDESEMPNAVKVLWFYLNPEYQGNFYKTKKLIRLAYDVLLDERIFSIYGTVSQAEQSFYPFASKDQESQLLAARNDEFVNNLQRMYVASGAIAIGDQVYWFSPDGVQVWLLRSDSAKFREALDQLRKNRKSIFTDEERKHHAAILDGALI